MTIFLIEDDPDDQEFFLLALQDVKERVTLYNASSGAEALSKLSNRIVIPDIIFMDINMPRMNGWQCLAMIRKIKGLETLPVIIYSTPANRKGKEELDKYGVTAYVTKQTGVASLTKILEQVFSAIKISRANVG